MLIDYEGEETVRTTNKIVKKINKYEHQQDVLKFKY